MFDKMPQRDLVLGILWLWVRIELKCMILKLRFFCEINREEFTSLNQVADLAFKK